MVKSPMIAAYHPEIWVRKVDGKISQIVLDLDDWYDEVEAIRKVALAHPGCRTFGELVEAVRGNRESCQTVGGLMSARIEENGLTRQSDARIHDCLVREWDELIDTTDY